MRRFHLTCAVKPMQITQLHCVFAPEAISDGQTRSNLISVNASPFKKKTSNPTPNMSKQQAKTRRARPQKCKTTSTIRRRPVIIDFSPPVAKADADAEGLTRAGMQRSIRVPSLSPHFSTSITQACATCSINHHNLPPCTSCCNENKTPSDARWPRLNPSITVTYSLHNLHDLRETSALPPCRTFELLERRNGAKVAVDSLSCTSNTPATSAVFFFACCPANCLTSTGTAPPGYVSG